MATLPKAYALFETTLQDNITSAGTSMTLVTGTDKEGTNLAGTIGYIIDEGTASEEFVIGATTATAVTSMARGVSSSDGTTEVAENKKAHRKGASIKITNHPLLIRLYRIANGDDAFPDNAQTLGDGSLLASSAAPTSDAMIANKKYIDDTAIAGGAKATEVIYGISKLSVAADSAVAPIAVGDNDNRVPTVDTSTVTADMVAALAGTGTPNGTTGKYVTLDSATATPTASKIPIADGSNKLDEGWLQMTDAQVTTLTDGSETTLHTHKFSALNFSNSGDAVGTNTDTNENSIISTTISGGTMGADSALKITFRYSIETGGSNPIPNLRVDFGSKTQLTRTLGTGGDEQGYAEIVIINASASVQNSRHFLATNISGVSNITGTNTGTEDTTNDVILDITSQFNTGSSDSTITISGLIVEIIK